ncbi:MAG: exodeoxyribonuclease VII large subunit [Alphaproteobacteria bacterium]|nr:exodeoxyribonuclease VII large subunit [Alphaproteobacteria bacterium]
MNNILSDHNLFEYSVSEISRAIKETLEGNFAYIRVRGEISGYKKAGSSGHIYLALKDNESILDAVCWRTTVNKLTILPEDGLEVIATGRITNYAGRSKYQLVIESLEIAGQGALLKLLEQRKAQFLAEGLFDRARKKPLPAMPKIIGVITSLTGAVIKDILHRLTDRFPCHVLVWPVLVQGPQAAEQIAAAIKGFNRIESLRPDLVIIARGGGSLEDLWAFNEEIIIRAVVESSIPIISAIGHETDTTLIDYAADLRAPTPTAAAEMAVPVRANFLFHLEELNQRLWPVLSKFLELKQFALMNMTSILNNPSRLIEEKSQKLDGLIERITYWSESFMRLKKQTLLGAGNVLKNPYGRISSLLTQYKAVESLFKQSLFFYIKQIKLKSEKILADFSSYSINNYFFEKQHDLQQNARLLDNLSIKTILKRGFVFVTDTQGQTITSVNKAKQKEKLILHFIDGKLETKNSKPFTGLLFEDEDLNN